MIIRITAITKKCFKYAAILLGVYLIYAFVFGVVVFRFLTPAATDYLEQQAVDRFWEESVSKDRVALLEGRYESGLARINLIENAEESLDIAYFSIHDGMAANIFFSSIIEAAERGVEVRILLDGIFHNMRFDLKDVAYALHLHPNIELKIYEPIDLLRPWTWNNRLHDKLIIVDENLAMIGGRNIGDEYFVKEDSDAATNDRDVVIVNVDVVAAVDRDSAIIEMKTYYDQVWNHEFSEHMVTKLSTGQQRKGEAKILELKQFLGELEEANPEMFDHSVDWVAESFPTNNVTFIHNPLERFNKEPWVWYELTNLAGAAAESVFVQSPYIIPTKKMMEILDEAGVTVQPEAVNVLTNSLGSTPNVFAYAGHKRHRKPMVDAGLNVYEYHGPGSLHAKTLMVDDRLSAVGTFNLDARSAFLSTESMVVIDSAEFTEHLKNEIEYIMGQSLKVADDYSYLNEELEKLEAENADEDSVAAVTVREATMLKRLMIGILSLFSYLFEHLL